MDIPVNYLTPPADVINQSIDILGESGKIIGDITDGTTVAETARRNYGRALRQLLRAAWWDWARKNAPLQLLGDAVDVPPPLGVSSFVEAPWCYAYAWPLDAVAGRWLPWNGQLGQTTPPPTTAPAALVNYAMTPGRFLVASSDQYPAELGTLPWNQLPDLQRTEGLGPISRKIILTNIPNANFVYTRLETIIEVWDDLFRQAMVTMMALILAPVAIDDPKLRLAARNELIPILKNIVAEARVVNGLESGFPQSVDFEASFIRARTWGVGNSNSGTPYPDTGGILSFGWEQMSWAGSVF